MNRTLNDVAGTGKGQKTLTQSITTRKLVAAGLALLCLGTATPSFAEFNSALTLKLGGTLLYNHRAVARQAIGGIWQGGGHISFDITVPGAPIAIAPFLNVYHKGKTAASATQLGNDASMNMIGGMNFLFTGPRNRTATMYFGLGGGATRLKVATSLVGPVVASTYKVQPMADALIGLLVKVAPRVSLYVEPHYFFSHDILNGMSVSGGIGFHFGKYAEATQPEAASPVYVPVYVDRVKVIETPAKAAEPVPQVDRVPSSAEALATMREMIYFPNNVSDLSDSAKMILDDKVTVFKANPAMRIVIVGFASKPGTEEYNMALGLKRAEAAKAYLVSKGVDPIRIEIATRGAEGLAVEDAGEAVDATNRRGQFRLLIADPYLAEPKK